jgi:hypothetical protein
VSREPLSVRAGDRFVSVTATDRLSALSVSVVTRTADQLVTVFIFPARREPPAPGTQYREIPLTSSDAIVREILPAGDYSAVAVGEGVFDADWREPHILERLQLLASQATVRAGQTTQLTLRVSDLK